MGLAMTADSSLPPLDEHGHLADASNWSVQVAELLALNDGVELSNEHWELIDFVRSYHADYATAPGMRLLVASVKRRLGPDKASSRYLYRLFPDSPARQLACYAGLSKPVSCI